MAIGQDGCTQSIGSALEQVVREGHVLTRDLGGTAATHEFADAIRARMT